MFLCLTCMAPSKLACNECQLAVWCSRKCAEKTWANHALLHEEDPTATEIIPGIWISGLEPLCTHFMEKIDSVLTVLPLHRVDEKILDSLLKNKIRHRIQVEDEPEAPIEEYFFNSAEWIQKQRNLGRKVLIHCAKGRSRSTTILMAYMLQHPNPDDLLFMMRAERPIVNPNPGFMDKLRKFTSSEQTTPV